MSMSRCYSLMKCLLILFNIIFLCVGSCACGFAAWALWDGQGAESPAARAGLLAGAAWGGVLALGALAALCGAARGSAPLLAAAFCLLALTGVAEAAAAWWGAAHRPQLRRALLDALDHTVRHEYGVLPSRTQLLDVIQQGLQCCGSAGPRDWQHSAWARAQGGAGGALDLSVAAPPAFYPVPASCCAAPGAACEAARRVAAASGGGAGLHGAACGARVLAALARLARVPLALGGALLALHAAALPLAAALWLRAHPRVSYKA
ncbi:tetraspanin-11-like [Helicoverpa zea]|uniref:tetraspanin-11-like n=1 Tax=Helicoverpa zea TaxID=7113 RepID=UPI001F595748|nr:tetraspanin-11-like [Helicoverpa zea]XP_049703497.1 tetraspanin-11-like [Helicoverpa armigera]